jgi:hypothetical protein
VSPARRELPPSSPFAGDDGSCDPALGAALDAYDSGDGFLAGVVVALAAARVLVPVLAELEAADLVTGGSRELTVDTQASAGIVALRAADGRTALPVFTSVASMARWRTDARPVPTGAARAALSAVTEQWELVVLDPGGPTTALIPRPAVWALAQEREWEPAVIRARGDHAGGTVVSVDARVSAAVVRSVGSIAEVLAVEAVPGRRAEVGVVLTLVPGLDARRLDAVLARVNAALAADEVVAMRVDSLELRLRSGS